LLLAAMAATARYFQDVARRIAANIAKLPVLVRQRSGPTRTRRLKENPAVGAAGKLGELEMNAHNLPPMAACYKAHFVSGRD